MAEQPTTLAVLPPVEDTDDLLAADLDEDILAQIRAGSASWLRRNFKPIEHITFLDNKAYLEVKWRLVWLRIIFPSAQIDTELMAHGSLGTDDAWAWFKATIVLPTGAKATGHGLEFHRNFKKGGGFAEKAETVAIGRALIALGFGGAAVGSAEGFDLEDARAQNGADYPGDSAGVELPAATAPVAAPVASAPATAPAPSAPANTGTKGSGEKSLAEIQAAIGRAQEILGAEVIGAEMKRRFDGVEVSSQMTETQWRELYAWVATQVAAKRQQEAAPAA
jgi:hypothetical protein